MIRTVETEKARVADVVSNLPACPLNELYEGSPRVNDRLMTRVFEAADALLKQRDRLAWSKMRGLQALDDYNTIHVEHGDLMFLLGVEYGRRLSHESQSPLRNKR